VLLLTGVLALASCYRGAGTEDPREANATGVLPWGTVLAPGKTADKSGIGFVTRRDECCGIAIESDFVVPNVRGSRALYFDVYVPAAGRRLAFHFRNGRSASTEPLPSGPATISVSLPNGAIDATGAAALQLTVSATAPDSISAANGPTTMTFFGVATDREVSTTSADLPKVTNAK
jgi:hypothetical protein